MSKIGIIGGGPGGYETALYAASKGFDVLLVEKGKIGGTCLNMGCIPTKALLADALSGKYNRSEYELIIERRDNTIENLRNGVEKSLKRAKIEVVSGIGSILSPKSISVQFPNGDTESYNVDFVIVATGSKPFTLNLPGFKSSRVLNSDSIWNLDPLPESIAIIGGGVIGMEFATAFSALGIVTTVMEYESSILANLDTDLVKRYKAFAKGQGIGILTGTEVTSIEEKGDSVVISYIDKNGNGTIESNYVLTAVGRMANVPDGILDTPDSKHNNGYVNISDGYETSIPGVYAIGDVNGKSMLAHSAVSQGRQLIDYLVSSKPIGQKYIPACVFTDPEMATVGMTEENCRESGIAFISEKVLYGTNGKAMAAGVEQGFVKIIADHAGRILGVHILGAHASDLIHYGVIAMEGGLTVMQLSEMVFAHPTLGELFLECAKRLTEKLGGNND